MQEDEEHQPIKLADMGGPPEGSVETRVRGGGRGVNARGARPDGGLEEGFSEREREREREFGNAMKSGDSGDSSIYVHTIIEQDH